MIKDFAKLILFMDLLNKRTNDLAQEIYTIRQKMIGRGINPAEVPIVNARLEKIEQDLRKIAADKDNPLPVRD